MSWPLIIDAAINLFLGVVLLLFSSDVVSLFGIPASSSSFYPNILGGVFIGITAALLIEALRKPAGITGLGLGGAVAINLCGGLVLVGWLLFGGLTLPTRGLILLWSLAAVLVLISSAELIAHLRRRATRSTE
jgi:hypothetical protein